PSIIAVHISYIHSSTLLLLFFVYSSVDLRDLHSFPTRRSSDLYQEIRQFAVGYFLIRVLIHFAPFQMPLLFLHRVPFDSSAGHLDRKSTRLNSSHVSISYAVFCLKKKKTSISRSWQSYMA